MSNRIIARISKENQASAVIERAKQRFTSLQNTEDLSRLKTLFLDFDVKDDNFVQILKGDEFPEVIGAVWDREIYLTGVETDDSQTYGLEEVDVQGGSFDRRAIAESLSTDNEDIDALARQIKPSDYGNVIPYNVGSGTQYSIAATVVNTTSGPKLYINGSQAPDLTYVFPGHELVIDVSDNSNFGYTLAFSETPDGTHNGGTNYVVGVSRTATPGTTGAEVTLTVSQTTPQQLYLYANETSRVGLRGGGFLNATDHCKVAIFSKWYLARITQQQNSLNYGLYSYTEHGEGVDCYVIDTGIRGASRPTNVTGANLHPELFHPDYADDYNTAINQAEYRVYEVPGYNSGYTVNGEANSNEDDNGHGSQCAILIGGLEHGVARKTRFYALKCQNSAGSGLLSTYVFALLAIINHNDPAHPNYKGSTRPAIINASLGVGTIPSEVYRYVPQNEPGFDSGSYEADTAMDDYENLCVENGIVFVRSAGNGYGYNFKYGGFQAKFNPGPRTAGPQDYRYNMEGISDKISVGATAYNNTFSGFSNYGTGVTTSGPGESIYCPQYYWNTNSSYSSVGSIYYAYIRGTSFSGPLTAGVIAQYLGKKGYENRATYEGKSVPKLAKEWIRREIDWDYERTQSAVGEEYGGGSVNVYPTNDIDEITLDGINTYIAVGAGTNEMSITLGSEFSRFDATVGDKMQFRIPEAVPSVDIITDVWVSSDGSPTAAYYQAGGLLNLVTDNDPAPGLAGVFPSGGTTGYVSTLSIQNQGSGYTIVPSVAFTGGGGTGATATADITLTGGNITSINVDQSGAGYTEAPTVDIAGDGTGATATAVISLTGGGIDSVTVTNGGSGYNPLNLPAVTFTGGGGSGATAVAVITDGIVSAVNISNPGSGYSEAPTVGIAISAAANQGNTIHAPDSSFVSGGGSTTSSSLNQTTRLLTVIADNLPQPALYGAFPNSNNSNTITGQSYNHTWVYRGGRNISDESPTSTLAQPSIGMALNGVQLRHLSHGLNVDLPDGTGCPDGYTFNKIFNSTAFGADNGSGVVDGSGMYHYITGNFLVNTWKGSSTTYTVTINDPGGGNKYYLNNGLTPNIILTEGNTYYFDQSDVSNAGYPFRISETQDGVHTQGGVAYEIGYRYQGTPGDGVSGTGLYLQVQPDTPNLYYYCSLYSGYGNAASVTTTTNTAALPSHTTADIINATHHSPVIGYAYDGYPIYGPIGYSSPGSPTTLSRMQSSWGVKGERDGTQYSGSTYTWGVTADDSLDFDFTGEAIGSDIAIAANIGDNLVFNVNASYTTGGGGGSTPATYNLVVTASGFSDYTVSGSDRTGNVSGSDPSLTFYEGDTINFTVSASGHPFYLKTAAGTGTGNQISGVSNQGTQSGTVAWTPGIGSAGTYYYQCEYHGGMVGTITIQSAGGGGGTTITHPFWIQKVPAPYNPAQVVAGVVNNGSYNATLLWSTTTTAPGTYYYVCENHQAMTGTITLTEPVGYAPSTTAYPMGSFVEDYQYLGGGNLDRCNGRYCVTPEFPGGTYAYFTTFDASANPAFPYILGDRYYGEPVTEADTAPQNPIFEQPASSVCTIGTQIGVVDTINVTDQGVGYTYANITFSGGGGVGTVASPNISVLDGYVSGLNLIEQGSGYTTSPTVTINPPNVSGGVQATSVAQIAITAGNPNSIDKQSFNQNFNWRGGTNYASASLVEMKPLRSVNAFGITTTGTFLYHYSFENGPTPGWTYNTVTNGNLVGEDSYGGYPSAANVYGYNSSKLLSAYGTVAVSGSNYLSQSYYDLGYRTVNYIITTDTKSASAPYYNQGSLNNYVLRGDTYTVNVEAPQLDFTRGNTYIFDLSDSSNDNHPMYFSTTDDGIHNGGVRYSDGVTYRLDGAAVDAVTFSNSFNSATTRTVTIVVPQNSPALLYYVCVNHPRMGNQSVVNSNVQGDYKRHTNGHSKILGMTFDGYPIYGPYGYSDRDDNSSAVIRMKPAYLPKLENRVPDMFGSRPDKTTYPIGSFNEDFEFQGGSEEDNITDITYNVQAAAATVSGSGGRYYISGGTLSGSAEKPSFNFKKGRKYTFNLSDSSNTSHMMLLSTNGDAQAQGWHVAGSSPGDVNAVYTIGVVYKLEDVVVTYSEYVAGFDTATLRSIEYTPASNAPHVLYYFCYNHSNMGERIIIGDVDSRNGRYCVTPDYPNGTYAYFITEDQNGAPAYPYIMGDYFYSDPVYPGGNAVEGSSYVYDIGGVQFNVLQRYWQTITDVDTANSRITIEPDAAQFTGVQSETGGNLIKIANLNGTHQRADGIQRWMDENPVGNKLYFQTEAQEDAGNGEGDEIVYLPTDKGVDGGYVRGLFSPYINLLTTWYTPAGALGTFNIGDVINLQLGVSFLRTYAAETILDRDYSLTGDSIVGTGLAFDTETGVLSGTLINNTTLDLTLTVEENISGQTQEYTIQLTNTTVTVQNVALKTGGASRTIDYLTVTKKDGQPNDDLIWEENKWYSRPLSYKSFSVLAYQTGYENTQFDYLPQWQIWGDKGAGFIWHNINEYSTGPVAAGQSCQIEEGDWFENNLAARDQFYSYNETFEDVTGHEIAISFLIVNKWWNYDQDFFRLKMRYRLTFNLVATGNDYATVINESGSTVFEVPKGATYRFDISDASWVGKNLELRESATGSAYIGTNVRRYGTPGTPGAWVDLIVDEAQAGSVFYFGQAGGTTFATQHLDFTSVFNALLSNTLQLGLTNIPAVPAQPLLTMESGATSITSSSYSVVTEYGALTHFPNTLPYQSSNKSPKDGRYPVNLVCTDQNIEFNWYRKLYSYDTSTGVKSYNWDTVANTSSTYVPLKSPHYRSRRDYGNNTTAYHSSCVLDGASIYEANYVSFDEDFPLRVNYGGPQIEIPVQSSSQLQPPLANDGTVLRVTDLPCKGIPSGVNDPYAYQVVVGNGDALSSVSNEISAIANPPEMGMWWYEYANGWTGTVSNGYLRHDQGFVDTTLTCGDYFGNVLVRSFVIDVGPAPLSALPYIDINTLQVQDYYKGAQNLTVSNNQSQDVTVSYTIDAGQFTWRLRLINEFPYMENVDSGTRTVYTTNNPAHANAPTIVNTGDFSTYSGQLAAATGVLRECPFRGDTNVNLPVDFSVKNDIQPAIFPARGTQKVYTLWVELVESPFDLVDLINLVAVADPCQDHTYDFAYTSNGACITPSNDYFCNFIKPLRDRGHGEQPIIGMEGVAQIKVTDGIAPRALDFQIPAPWPVLFSYLGDCNPTCA